MIFDEYMRGASIVAIVVAAFAYMTQLAGRQCDSLLLVLVFFFVQGPAVLFALVAPFAWRYFQARPIERKTRILFTWALVVTAFQVTLAFVAVASISPPNACFK
jgi:hypothetical protein